LNEYITPHLLLKKGDIGEYVLLPGDPKRAKLIAEIMDESKLISANREFLVYTGKYGGVTVSVASTGIGGPSAAIAFEELLMVGAKVFIRVGTCGALRKGIEVPSIIIPYAAVRMDGVTKRYVDPEFPAVATPEIYLVLKEEAEKQSKVKVYSGIVVSDDAFYVEKEKMMYWANRGAIAIEMESSTIFTLAQLKGVKAGTILVVDGNIPEGTGKAVKGGFRGREYSEEIAEAIRLEAKIALEAVKRIHGNY